MPLRTYNLSDEAAQKLEDMARAEERSMTNILNRIILDAEPKGVVDAPVA